MTIHRDKHQKKWKKSARDRKRARYCGLNEQEIEDLKKRRKKEREKARKKRNTYTEHAKKFKKAVREEGYNPIKAFFTMVFGK